MRPVLSLLILILSLNLPAQSTNDLPFQVLVAKDASVYGTPVEPLQMIDDVTSVEVKEGGFLSLVHKGGTTFEHTEKIFTFYLKPAELRNRKERPRLELLYMDSTVLDPTKIITVLSPPFDRSGYLEWNENEPFELYWHLYDEPVLSYVLAVSDGSGAKIQDFRTKHHQYLLKPTTYGLRDGLFSFKLSSTFADETIESKTYTVQLKAGPIYENKASDLILKALDLELSPELALPVWQEALAMPNGQFFKPLFEKFLIRNRSILTAAGQDVQQLLSQNR
ncbi:MAG: hypothetical protein RLN88_16065 [Ekhidna sp.]|uniref:hypothetical protein n=1 Tax=Ekhidna sp. TaxID=2608089 RepID=UPI0032EF34CE